MANTRDTMGEQACLDALIAGALTEFEDDEVYKLRPYALAGSTQLETLRLQNCKKIYGLSLSRCSNLTTIMLGYDGVVLHVYYQGNAAILPQFNSGGTGIIYVPASQLAAYQSSSSWNTYNLAAIAE